MHRDPDEWLRSLPLGLRQHEVVLRHLVAEAEADERIRLLLVGCSIGRGAADERSDIDAYIGIVEREWPGFMSEIDGLVTRLGEVVDRLHQLVPSPEPGKGPYHHTFAQYASGVQLDLAVSRAPDARQPRPDWVVLYDADARVSGEPKVEAATADQVRSWMFNGFVHLSACAKYIARGSLWEALDGLHRARAELWRLWAVAQRVPDPQYGHTAVLDSPGTPLPPGIETTLAPLEREELGRAAIDCADLLMAIWPQAISAVSDAALPPPLLAAWVRRQLTSRHRAEP